MINIENIEKLLLAFLEEKCHVHPTAEVVWEDDFEDLTGVLYYPRIGGFECGIRISEGDLLNWLIDTDKKVSEIKDYR